MYKELHIKRLFLFISFSLVMFFLTAESNVTFYVDAGIKTGLQKGTIKSPFHSLEKAVAAGYDYVHRKQSAVKNAPVPPVTIIVRSDVYVDEAVLLTGPVTITGLGNPTITFGENAGFVVERTALEINSCAIRRSEHDTEPRTVPLLYGAESVITLKNVSLTAQEGGDTVILRGGQLACTDSSFISEQSAQAVLICAEKTTIEVSRSTFSVQGLTAFCFNLIDSKCSLTEVNCTLFPRYTGRLAELVRSELKTQELRCSYQSPLFDTIDAAVIADAESHADFQEPVTLTGFLQPLVQQ